MVRASTSAGRVAARNGLNATTSSLRTWHERLLFGSSTLELARGAIQYHSRSAMPAYRSTPLVEQVSHCILLSSCIFMIRASHPQCAVRLSNVGITASDRRSRSATVSWTATIPFAMQERKRAAMLLSQLPADIDIALLLQAEAVTTTASNATRKQSKAKKGNAVAPSSGFKSVRVD